MITEILKDLHSFVESKRLKTFKNFFKTGPGEYSEMDVFIGVSVPNNRMVARRHHKFISLNEIKIILSSKIHEERLLALLILSEKFKTKNEKIRSEIFDFYADEENLKFINNWDLVDTSCYKIFGEYLACNPEKIDLIYEYSKSDNLWKRRISIVSTLAFIRKFVFDHTMKISELLLNDKHDLIHKAAGWMLREVGKRDQDILISFLKENRHKMPKTMFNYSVEKIDKKLI